MHAIERLYPFVVQDAGYYSGWVLSDQFARMEISNLNFFAQDASRRLMEHEDRIRGLQHEISVKEAQMDGLSELLQARQAELDIVFNSKSWRLTEPLRRITLLLRRY